MCQTGGDNHQVIWPLFALHVWNRLRFLFYIYEAQWTFWKRLLLRCQERGTRGTHSIDMAEYNEFKKRQKKLGCYESTTKQPISPSLWTPCFWWHFYWKHTKTSCIYYAVHKRRNTACTCKYQSRIDIKDIRLLFWTWEIFRKWT